MKVSDILRVKGGTLYTVAPESALQRCGQDDGRAATSARWSS